MKRLSLALFALTLTLPFAKLALAEPAGWKDIKVSQAPTYDTPINLTSLRQGSPYSYFKILRLDDAARGKELSVFADLDFAGNFSQAEAPLHHAEVSREAIWINLPVSHFTAERAYAMKIMDQFTDIVTIKQLGTPGYYHAQPHSMVAPASDCQLTFLNSGPEFDRQAAWAHKMNPELPAPTALELTVSKKTYELSFGFGRFSYKVDALHSLATLVSYHPLPDGTTVVVLTSLSAIPRQEKFEDKVLSSLAKKENEGLRQLAAALRTEK